MSGESVDSRWPVERVLRSRLAAAIHVDPRTGEPAPADAGAGDSVEARALLDARRMAIEHVARELGAVAPARCDAALCASAVLLSYEGGHSRGARKAREGERVPISSAALDALAAAFGRPVTIQRAAFVSIPCAGEDAPAIASAALLAAAYLDRIRGFETETLADVDPEGVHQIRVAVRRLRCVLRLLERVTGSRAYRRASAHVRAVGRAASQLRDVDVAAALVKSLRLDARARRAVLERIAARRVRGLAKVRGLLTSAEHDVKMAALARLFVADAASTDKSPLGDAAHHEIQRSLKRLRRVLARGLTDVSSYHDVRRQARRVRDIAEVFGDALRKNERQWRKRLHSLQALLGSFNDVDVTRAMIPSRTASFAPARDALERRRSALLAELGPPLALLAIRLARKT